MAGLKTLTAVALAGILGLQFGCSCRRLRLSAEQVAEAWLARTCSMYETQEQDRDLEDLVKGYGSDLVPIFKAALEQGPSAAARKDLRSQAAEDYREMLEELDRNPNVLGPERAARLRQTKLEDFVARVEADYVAGWASAAIAGLALSGEQGLAQVRKVLADERSPYREAAQAALKIRR